MRVKQLLAVIAFLFLLSSCTGDYTQVIITGTSNDDVKRDNSYWVYENDTIKVVYYLWDQWGRMNFAVYNKSKLPIYIDWKKSSFINRDRKIAYYSDKATSSYAAVTNTVGVSGAFSRYSASFTSGAGTMVKEERVTFIPPRSYIYKSAYRIAPNVVFDINNRKTRDTTINGHLSFVTTTKSKNKIFFRNFLAYSFNEDFKGSEFYVDNEFYIKKIITVRDEDFKGNPVGISTDQYEYPFYSPSRFYIEGLTPESVFPPGDK